MLWLTVKDITEGPPKGFRHHNCKIIWTFWKPLHWITQLPHKISSVYQPSSVCNSICCFRRLQFWNHAKETSVPLRKIWFSSCRDRTIHTGEQTAKSSYRWGKKKGSDTDSFCEHLLHSLSPYPSSHPYSETIGPLLQTQLYSPGPMTNLILHQKPLKSI